MRFIFTYIFICISFLVFAQNNIFDFSNLSFSSRSSAMGGDLITIYDNDINISSINPSYLNSEMQNTISLSFVDYYYLHIIIHFGEGQIVICVFGEG